MTTTSATRWRIGAAACALLLGTLLINAWIGETRTTKFELGSFTLVETASAATLPAVNQNVASEAARQQLATLNPSVRDLSISGAHLAIKLRTIERTGGELVYSSSPGEDAWVFEFAGPAQNGFQKVEALVVVNANTGEVVSAQIMQSN